MRKIFRCQDGKDGGLEDTAHQNQWTDDKSVEKVEIAVCDRDGSVLFVDALSGTLGQRTERKAAHAQTGENGPPRKSNTWDAAHFAADEMWKATGWVRKNPRVPASAALQAVFEHVVVPEHKCAAYEDGSHQLDKTLALQQPGMVLLMRVRGVAVFCARVDSVWELMLVVDFRAEGRGVGILHLCFHRLALLIVTLFDAFRVRTEWRGADILYLCVHCLVVGALMPHPFPAPVVCRGVLFGARRSSEFCSVEVRRHGGKGVRGVITTCGMQQCQDGREVRQRWEGGRKLEHKEPGHFFSKKNMLEKVKLPVAHLKKTRKLSKKGDWKEPRNLPPEEWKVNVRGAMPTLGQPCGWKLAEWHIQSVA